MLCVLVCVCLFGSECLDSPGHLNRGFADLPYVGQTGLGKSTLINTIFASHLIDSKGRLAPDEPVRATTEIQTVSHSTFVLSHWHLNARYHVADS